MYKLLLKDWYTANMVLSEGKASGWITQLPVNRPALSLHIYKDCGNRQPIVDSSATLKAPCPAQVFMVELRFKKKVSPFYIQSFSKSHFVGEDGE